MPAPWKKNYDQPRQHIQKKRLFFSDKGPSSQSYGFSSSHVQMWELDHKESWAPKNWCFWSVILKKTLESPLDCEEIQLVHPTGSQSWIFIGRTDAEAEIPTLWSPDVKNWLIGKDADTRHNREQEETRATADEMVSITYSVDVNLSKRWEIVEDRGAWHAAVHEVAKSWTQLNNNS